MNSRQFIMILDNFCQLPSSYPAGTQQVPGAPLVVTRRVVLSFDFCGNGVSIVVVPARRTHESKQEAREKVVGQLRLQRCNARTREPVLNYCVL